MASTSTKAVPDAYLSVLDLYFIGKLSTFTENKATAETSEDLQIVNLLIQNGSCFSPLFFLAPSNEPNKSIVFGDRKPVGTIIPAFNNLQIINNSPVPFEVSISPLLHVHRTLLKWLFLQIELGLPQIHFSHSEFMSTFRNLLKAGILLYSAP